jgi:uncharacterized protein YegL
MATRPDSGGQIPEQTVVPLYFVCDESASMARSGNIDSVNKVLRDLLEVFAALGIDRVIRVCVISFSDGAEVLVPLARPADIDQMPAVREGGASNYSGVFRLLKTEISKDIETLRADGYRVFRTAMFFISDGSPTDLDWRDSFRELTDRNSNPQAPNVCAYCFSGADPDLVREIGTFGAWTLDDARNLKDALSETLSSLAFDLNDGMSESPHLVIPPRPDGETAIDLPLDTERSISCWIRSAYRWLRKRLT